MTHKSTWKKHERNTAKKLGGERTPLSGSNSKHTSGDIIHNKFYVECKYRKKFMITEIYKEAKAEAKKEGKLPLVVLKEKGQHGEYVLLSMEDFINLLDQNTHRNIICQNSASGEQR